MGKSAFQTFVVESFQTLLSILKILIFSRHSGIKFVKIKLEDVVILGNGPSLKTTIIDKNYFLENKSLICVNHFAETDFYQKTKPEFYILGAPEMWRNDVEIFHLEKGKKLFKAISEQTAWDIKLFIPTCARKYQDWQSQIKKNNRIEVVYYNKTPGDGNKWFRHFIFRNNWAMPRPHNVLIPSLMIALNLQFKNIYIAGADHSWMKDIYVSDNNQVFLTQKHFYDSQTAEPRTMDKGGNGERRLFEILEKWTLAFHGYFIIKEYADSRQQKIINITPESYIDAFERLKI